MSLIKVYRNIFHKDWTISNLLINNELDGYIVEDEIREKKIDGETAIDYGTYNLGTRYSPKFSKYFLYSESKNILIDARHKSKHPELTDLKEHELIWILNVPKFEYILMHWGNTDKNSRGCLLVGQAIGIIKGRQGVVSSRAYYKKFYPKVFPLIKAGRQKISIIKDTSVMSSCV